MQATANPTSVHPLLSIGQAAAKLGICPNTLRSWTNDGQFPAVVLPSGHRRYRVEDINQWMGFDADEKEGEGTGVPVALLGRVSTDAQARSRTGEGGESDLQRQMARLHDWVNEHHPDANVTDYARCASGLYFDDATFQRFIGDLLDGKFKGGYVVVLHRDRLCRAGFQLVESLIKRGGATLVIVNDVEKSHYESLAEDIVALCTAVGAKLNGQKAAVTCSKRVSAKAVERMIELRQQNHSVVEITKMLSREGYAMGTGTDEENWTEKPSQWVVAKYLDNNGVESALTTAVGQKKAESPLDAFLSECVKRTEERKDKVPATKLRAVYSDYCRSLGLEPEAPARFGQLLSARGIGRCSVKGNRQYYGITLTATPS